MNTQKKDEKLIKTMIGFIRQFDIDESVCKKVDCRREGLEEETDDYDCYDCLREYFSKSCKWLAENEVCVLDKSENCTEFVDEYICGFCRFREI